MNFLGGLLEALEDAGRNFSQRAYEVVGDEIMPLLTIMLIAYVAYYGLQLVMGTARVSVGEIFGRVVRMILPPAEFTWHLAGVEREVEVEYGFHPKAYTEGRSNGAWFIMELRTPGQPPQEIFRRLLDPARQPADRQPLRTRLPLPPFPPGPASWCGRTRASSATTRGTGFIWPG